MERALVPLAVARELATEVEDFRCLLGGCTPSTSPPHADYVKEAEITVAGCGQGGQ